MKKIRLVIQALGNARFRCETSFQLSHLTLNYNHSTGFETFLYQIYFHPLLPIQRALQSTYISFTVKFIEII